MVDMLLRFSIRVLQSILRPLERWQENRYFRRQRAKFPLDSRVRVIDGCPCGRNHIGEEGRVDFLSTEGGDWMVELDSGVRDMFCEKSLKRIR